VTEENPTESMPIPGAAQPADATPTTTSDPPISWAPPPPVTAATMRPGPRSTLSLAAGILLVVLGALGVLIAIAMLTVGRQLIAQIDFSGMPGVEGVNDPNALAEGFLAFAGIVLLVCSTFYVVGGVGAMRSKNWGRVIGVVIGVLGGLFWLVGLANGSPRGTGFVFVLLAIHAYVLVALLFFWRTRAPAA
jgi:hypothetical protein